MLTDLDSDRTMQRAGARPARRPWMHLLNAVMDLAEDKGQLLRHAERPWASVTFTGSRHIITLAFAGSEAVEAGERFIAALAEHEFAIPRQLVADAKVVAADHVLDPEPRLVVECELLLLEDA